MRSFKSLALLILFFSLAYVAAPTGLFAQTTQTVNAVIHPDFSISVDLSVPMDTNRYGYLNLNAPKQILKSSGVDFHLIRAYDASGTVPLSNTGDGHINLRFNNKNLKTGMRGLHLQLEAKPLFDDPAYFSYTIPLILDPDFFIKPTVDLTFPNQLKLIGTLPTATTTAITATSTTLHIDYPIHGGAGDVEADFFRGQLPNGYVLIDEGIFSIVGKADEAAHVRRIVKPLTFLAEPFKKVLGFSMPSHIQVVIGSYAGKGAMSARPDLAALFRGYNMLLVDESSLQSDITDLEDREIITHELTHSIINKNTFSGEIEPVPWFQEGMAVFMAQYIGDQYLHDQGYHFVLDSSGTPDLIEEGDYKLTEAQLLDRYDKSTFEIEVPKDPKKIGAFYNHSGLIITNFYNHVGETGMLAFMKRLTALHVREDSCRECESDRIFSIMGDISGLSKDQLIFPYRGDANFSAEVAPLVRHPFSRQKVDELYSEYYKQQSENQFQSTFQTVQATSDKSPAKPTDANSSSMYQFIRGFLYVF